MTNGPFTRKESVDEPGILGARWWQESIAVPRRQALTTFVVIGGVAAAMAVLGTCAVSELASSLGSSAPEHAFQPRNALAMQKEYGWDFGAAGEPLVFDGRSTKPFDRSALARMESDLAPADARLAPWFVATLFQSTTALPKSNPAGDARSGVFVPLKDALVPIFTATMDIAFAEGQALAALVEKEGRKDLAVIVDLVGEDAVAFAAGAASVLEPVFLFDNWPHPRGVVPAHRTLAAVAYYQPLFAAARVKGKGRPPMFVLDRRRLTTYTDEATQFDNRHVARLPSAAGLSGLGVKTAIYVAPVARESDDVVDDFLAYTASAIGLRLLEAFMSLAKSSMSEIPLYTPSARKTDFSAGTPATPQGTRPRPASFGAVPVAVAVGTGVILGAKLSRNGSWNRATGTSTGS